METYKCNICDMAVNASCAKCDEPLKNGTLTLEDGSSVQISKGQFSNLIGTITNVQGSKLTVEISMFGQPTKVNIKAADCEAFDQS